MDTAKTGRNDPCPCQSGKKFKHCCLNMRRDKKELLDIFKRFNLQFENPATQEEMLEAFQVHIGKVRMEAVGWAWGEAMLRVENGYLLSRHDAMSVIGRAMEDLNKITGT